MATDIAAPVITGPLSGETAPITDRAVAAALAASVDEVADGTFGRFQGDVTDYKGQLPQEGSAALLFEPSDWARARPARCSSTSSRSRWPGGRRTPATATSRTT